MTTKRDKAIAQAVIEAAAAECNRTMMFPSGRQESYAHHGVDAAADAIRSLDIDAIIVSVPGPWVSVKDRLPETFITDDPECWLQSQCISAAISSVRVLVALEGDGVRVDRLAGLDGKAPYWETYKERVTHWQLLPAAQPKESHEQD